MRVCVFGLWHLGTVTAGCLAAEGNEVTGLDLDPETIRQLAEGTTPLFEPGLSELIEQGLGSQKLTFSTDIQSSIEEAQLVWVTHDTPVDDDNHPDPSSVTAKIEQIFPYLKSGSTVLISSQLPVGTTRSCALAYAEGRADTDVQFAYSPENLRLGKAVECFRETERVVVGMEESERHADRIQKLLAPFAKRITWMSIESAEMTKHALNGFLATSVAFINEVAALCEEVGADAKEVEIGLKSEPRIGPKAHLAPGAAFSGGTLARDLDYLTKLGTRHGRDTHLLEAVVASNRHHSSWTRRQLEDLFPAEFKAKSDGQARVAVWGLAYKQGTGALKGSSSLELCKWITAQGLQVRLHDPLVERLPDELNGSVEVFPEPIDTLDDAIALVITNGRQEYLNLQPDTVRERMKNATVLDPNRYLNETLGKDGGITYVTVGRVTTGEET